MEGGTISVYRGELRSFINEVIKICVVTQQIINFINHIE